MIQLSRFLTELQVSYGYSQLESVTNLLQSLKLSNDQHVLIYVTRPDSRVPYGIVCHL